MSYKRKYPKDTKESISAGAPCKLTPAVQKMILDALDIGAPYRIAANSAGISKTSMDDWVKIGEDDSTEGRSTKYSAFSALVKKHVAIAACKKIKTIDFASLKEWQAAAWLLERRFPDEFGRHSQLDLNAKENLDFSAMTEKEILEFFRKLSFKNKTAIIKAFLTDHEKDLEAQGEK